MMRWVSMVFLVLIACQGKPSEATVPQSVRLNLAAEPISFDPRKARSLGAGNMARMFFEGLTRLSRAGEIEGALADQITVSEDGLEYRFHLRPSVWSNGDPVTAFDFVRTWKSLLDPHFASEAAYQLYSIRGAKNFKEGVSTDLGIHALDPDTLIVQLERPVAYFLELLAMPCYLPVHSSYTEHGHLIGNGPFLRAQWEPALSIHCVRNPFYWEADQVRLHQIDLIFVSEMTELNLFLEHQLDWAGSPYSTLMIEAIPKLRMRSDFHTIPALATAFFRVNTRSEEQPALSNPLFRHWLADSFDRLALVKHVLQGHQTAASHLIPPLLSGAMLLDRYVEALPLETLLSKPLSLLYVATPNLHSLAQAIQQQWLDRGVVMELEPAESRIYWQRLSEGRYQLALGSWFADFRDSVNFLEVFKYQKASTNNTGWENPRYVDLLTQAELCVELGERQRLLREAEQLLDAEMPVIPIYHFALHYLQRESLKGVVLSPLGQIDFRWAYFDEQH